MIVFLSWVVAALSGALVGASSPISRKATSALSSPVEMPVEATVTRTIRSYLKPSVYAQVVGDSREVAVSSQLESVEGRPENERTYRFSGAMLILAKPALTRSILTNYPLYTDMIHYIDESKPEGSPQTIRLRGGIWKFELSSLLKFKENSPTQISFEIIEGHFKGLTGEFLIEPGPKASERDESLVLMRGEVTAAGEWPPRVILEEGAKIVFAYTGQKMRSYVEAQKRNPERK